MRLELTENPSPEWTPEERLKLIARLAWLLESDMEQGHNWPKQNDAIERIRMIAGRGKEFLEANRQSILKGNQ